MVNAYRKGERRHEDHGSSEPNDGNVHVHWHDDGHVRRFCHADFKFQFSESVSGTLSPIPVCEQFELLLTGERRLSGFLFCLTMGRAAGSR